MSAAALKLNPAVAKVASNGQITCLICSTQVKPKAWTAHVNGKKHRDSVARVKQQITISGALPANLQKRAPAESDDAPANKRLKEDVDVPMEAVPNSAGTLPEDFFSSTSAAPAPGSVQTPWQKDRAREKEETTKQSRPDVIEGVPQGFFDDKKKDVRVREAVEKNEQLDAEYDKLMREVNTQDNEELRKIEQEEEKEALERDLDNIDEQMSEWKRVLNMEMLAEQVVKKVRERGPVKKEDESSDDEEIELNLGSWRSKGFV